jgi:DNA-binding Lrp family transcriptional regulator
MLDSVDTAIVRELRKNARLANKDLAERVAVAPSTCLVRHRALRERGVITGYRAQVNLATLGRPIRAMIAVRIRPHTRVVVDPFINYVLSLPDVVSLSHVAGPDDFLVQVAVADTEHLQRLVLDGFTNRREVARLHTQLIFAHVEKEVVPPTPEAVGGP